MQKLANIKLSIVLRIAIIGYLLMTIVAFLLSDLERNYYNILAVNMTEFYNQMILFVVITGILMIFYKKFRVKLLSLLISFSLLVYLLLFVIGSPAFSLMLGASLVALPPFVYSVSSLWKREEEYKHINMIVAIINLVIFISIIVFTILSRNMEFVVFEGSNLSNINDDSILYGNRTNFLKGSIVVLVLLLGVYFFATKRGENTKVKKIINIIIFSVVGLLLAYQVIHLSLMMVYRVQTLFAPTFDFGLIVQMFYNMKNLNGMVTTLERSVAISHLSIHMSPIYYVMLPVFVVFPFPETLQVLQIVVVAIGVIPLYLISKEFKLSAFVTAVVMVAYIFNPAITASNFYDLHENCFLAPLLLFVAYFMIKQKTIPLMIAFILTLMIKEDASIYLIILGLYFVLGYGDKLTTSKQKKKNIIFGFILIVVSAGYFIGITNYLNTSGDGAMFWRYENLNAYPEMNAVGIIIGIFQNPSYLLATMFSPDKIYHLTQVLFTLGLIPLLSKKITDYILIAPLIIFNFATTYPYQHQFGFQYYYGTTALLIFMMLLVLSDRTTEEHPKLNKEYFKIPIFSLAVISLTVYGVFWFQTRSYHFTDFQTYAVRDAAMKEFLIEIPSDKKIAASGYLTTYLANREVLYDLQYIDLRRTSIVFDYVIIDKRMALEPLEAFQLEATSSGYELSDLSNEYFMILVPIS